MKSNEHGTTHYHASSDPPLPSGTEPQLPLAAVELVGFGKINIQDAAGKPVAFCGVQFQTMEVNAQRAAFIVRACNAHYELVEALEHCLCYMEADSDDEQEQKDYAAAQATLAKAKGQP